MNGSRPTSKVSISRSITFQLADTQGFNQPQWHSAKSSPGLVEPRLVEALDDSPTVLIHGPRQSGKTTLAQSVGKKRGYHYFNLDNDVLRAAAEAEGVLLGQFRHRHSDIYGNREFVEHLRNRGKFFDVDAKRERDRILIDCYHSARNVFEVTEE